MTTKTTTRRSFTDEFKHEAVSLLASSGRPLTQIATELGIQPSMLRSWRGTVNGDGKRMASATGSLSAAAPRRSRPRSAACGANSSALKWNATF
jgi:transposase